MKLLLDEQVPARLARSFPERFQVVTVQQMGWTSLLAPGFHRVDAP